LNGKKLQTVLIEVEEQLLESINQNVTVIKQIAIVETEIALSVRDAHNIKYI
jgi:hypothetical protein